MLKIGNTAVNTVKIIINYFDFKFKYNIFETYIKRNE